MDRDGDRQTMAPTEEVGGEAHTRLRILDAAIACLSQFGNEKTTLNDVARVAGLARQTIYRYFPDRRALLLAVQALEADRLRAEVDLIAGESLSFEQFLLALIEARVATVRRYRTRQHLLEVDRGLVQSLFLSRAYHAGLTRELVAPQLQAALARGELRDGVDVEQAAEWVAITLSTLSTLTASSTFNLDDPAEVASFYARHICRGLLDPKPVGARASSSKSRRR